LSLLGSFVLGFLLGLFVFVDWFFVTYFFGGKSSLSLFNFTDSFFSECFLVFRPSIFHFFYVIKSNTLNRSLLSEDFVSFVLSSFSLFEFFMETPPSSSPSESLSFKFS
jgi:hypothetical protein